MANHTNAACGCAVVAFGAPGSEARRRCERGTCGRCKESRWRVAIVIDGAVAWEGFSSRSLFPTLRDAWFMLRGTPQAELVIRRCGRIFAWAHTNYRGECDACEVSPPHTQRVTEISPHWNLFVDDMAAVLGD